MRLVNTKAHAIVDYLLGLILLASGWLFGFEAARSATAVAISCGILTLLLAVITKFEFGYVWLIPLRIHLNIDVFIGAFLAASPWLFSFAEQVFKPHLVFGLTQMCIALLTDRVLWTEVGPPEKERRQRNYS